MAAGTIYSDSEEQEKKICDQPRQHIKKQRHYFANIHLVEAVVFPVVMYGCESWTIKKAEDGRTDAFQL